ncbi:YicC family protein [Comamonas faecalis]|uniref:YicC family protein n=2 Tax=Comamonas faecalis TaxID=1387849 RepID=A0ABP7RIJ9_9BURK
MTGYGSAQQQGVGSTPETQRPGRRLGLELRSVNSRFLDLSLRLSDELRAQEPQLRALLTRRLKRGKVELRAFVEEGDDGVLAHPSVPLLQQLGALQDGVLSWLPQAPPLSVADALRLCSQLGAPRQDWGDAVQQLADQALDALIEARGREGERLVAMLVERVQALRALALQAQPLVPELVAQQRQRFLQRWADAMGLAQGDAPSEAAQERALSEATAFALRIDVAEEITRLQGHLDEIERLLHKGGEVGKRLDFLIQELHREANTLGSKSATMELTRISVDMKVLIEQMREQVQNIE